MTPEQITADVNLLAMKIQARRADIRRHMDYFHGKQGKLAFASDEFKRYMKARFSGFSDNWCAPVAQAPVERMHFQGLRPYSGDIMPASVARRWDENDADRNLSEATLMMTIARRSYGLVTDNGHGKARISFENPDSAAVLNDIRSGEPRVGLIIVQDDENEYGTLFYPDVIFDVRRKKTATTSDTRMPPDLAGWKFDPASERPNYLHAVPLVEFHNQCLLDDSPISDIESVESMQDTVNVVWSYLLNGLDYASLPARVILGGDRLEEPVFDDKGEVVGAKPAELDKQVNERILQLTGDVTISEWSSSNLQVFIPVIEKAVEHIAAETRTPGHYLLTNAEVPATGYEVAEAGLVSKTIERIGFMRKGVKELNRLAALAEGDDISAKLIEDSEVVYANPQYRSQAVMTQALTHLKQTGFPLQYIAEWFGLSPQEVERVARLKREEDSDPEMTSLARVLIGDADESTKSASLGSEDSGTPSPRPENDATDVEENGRA